MKLKPCDLEKARQELARFETLKTAYERVAAGELRLAAGLVLLNESISEDDLYSIRTMTVEALRLQLDAQRSSLAAIGLDVSDLAVPERQEDDLNQVAALWG